MISNVGLAAFSTLMLGSDCRFELSASLGGCTGGGFLSPAPSSSKLIGSAIPAALEACDVDDVGRTFRPAKASF